MSHQAVTWAMDHAPAVWTSKGKRDTTARHVLQALAEFARADGTHAHPSVARLQYRTGYDGRTVRESLKRLEAAELIVPEGAVSGCTNYRLSLHRRRPPTDWADVLAEAERKRVKATERKRRSRASVTPSDGVTDDLDAEPEGGGHAVEQRDVTLSNGGRHASEQRDGDDNGPGHDGVSRPPTVLQPSLEPEEIQRGDGRRPTTGRGPTASAGPVGFVLAGMPERLRGLLAGSVPQTVTAAINDELARGLTPEQLVTRIARRWVDHGYERAAESASGPGIRRPYGVMFKLICSGQCPSPRCDDGKDLDTREPCRTCKRNAGDRAAQQRRDEAARPVQGAFLLGLPGGATPAPAGRQAAVPGPRQEAGTG